MDPTYLLLLLAPLALIGLAGGGGGGGGGGDDEPSNSGDDEVSGTTGNDLLELGDGDDVILSVFFDGETAGNDIVRGQGGDDILLDPDGSNELDGGDGDDVLVGFDRDGTEGADLLIGGDGEDRFYADDGDTVRGGDGDDRISVLFDPDEDPVIIEGYDEGGDVDRITFVLPSGTLPSDDGVRGTPDGSTTDFVQNGADVEFTLDGETLAVFRDMDAEDLREKAGFNDPEILNNRFIFINTPENISIPDLYIETVQLEDGGDRFGTVGLGSGPAFDIRGGDGDDRINTLGIGDNRVQGGEGDDRIGGFSGDDVLFGEAGNDIISGGAGDDEIRGGSGDDRLSGGSQGVDLLVGEDGNDFLSASDQADEQVGPITSSAQYADRLIGGAGDDELTGDNGDILNGGSGADLFAVSESGFAEELGIEDEAVVIQDFNPAEDRLDIFDNRDSFDRLTNEELSFRQSGTSVEIVARGRVFAILEGVTVADLEGADIRT
ncbi:calcium-binding protein [Aestuariibius insulae]|uniref:calcium-binding protein n=1 Tax=Aestuariibius insulae TaxID=2058287 RepID=UPI00345EA5B0